jgi:hypothetical protein
MHGSSYSGNCERPCELASVIKETFRLHACNPRRPWRRNYASFLETTPMRKR